MQMTKSGRRFKGSNLPLLKDIMIVFYSSSFEKKTTLKETIERWNLLKTGDDSCWGKVGNNTKKSLKVKSSSKLLHWFRDEQSRMSEAQAYRAAMYTAGLELLYDMCLHLAADLVTYQFIIKCHFMALASCSNLQCVLWEPACIFFHFQWKYCIVSTMNCIHLSLTESGCKNWGCITTGKLMRAWEFQGTELCHQKQPYALQIEVCILYIWKCWFFWEMCSWFRVEWWEHYLALWIKPW